MSPRSRNERGRTAESTPLVTPSSIQITAAPNAIDAVLGNASAMIDVTGICL